MNIKNISFKLVSFFLMLILLSCVFSATSLAAGSELPKIEYATDACLYSINADKFVFKHSDNDIIFPASAVKMTTGLIACELLENRLDERIIITEDMLEGAQGASIRLKAGMSVTVEELLLGLLCGGGNDAAIVIARLCSKSLETFVELMNDKSDEWGLRSTKFTNPTGLDDKNMTSTLSDILLLAKRASQNELYVRLSSTPYFSYSPYDNDQTIKIYNRNALISTYYVDGYRNSYVMGLMSSNTDLGGFSTIAYAERGDDKYICIVMGAQEYNGTIYSYEYANILLSYAFNNLTYKRVIESGTGVCSVNVELASPENGKDTATVLCVASQDAYALIPNNIDIDRDLEYRYYLHYDTLQAPLSERTVVGGVDIIYDGEIIATSKLITTHSLEANPLLKFLHDARAFLSGRAFILCACFVIVSLLLYFYIFLLKSRRKSVKNINYKNFY